MEALIRRVPAWNVLTLFLSAIAKLWRLISAAEDKDFGRANCLLVDENVCRQVHLVVERSIEFVGCYRVGGIAMNNVTGDDPGTAKRKSDRGNTRWELLLFIEPAHFLIHFLRRLVEPRITLQHKTDIRMATNDAGSVLHGAIAHNVVIAHKETKLSRGLVYQVADIAIVAQIQSVFEVFNSTGKA